MNKKIRGFEEVNMYNKCHSEPTIVPSRSTKGSAGADFRIKESLIIKPGETVVTMSDVKAYMGENEVLKIYVRSSVGIKKKLRLPNGTGIIDSDYYSNPDNDGNIGIALHNFGEDTVYLSEGERVVQGIFINFLIPDEEEVKGTRIGGVGSTGKKELI
jgi:dUTP pyrophosphatase